MSDTNTFPLDWDDEEPITAQNNFTDRDEFRKILIDAVEIPQSITEVRVKVFYGAGGQGKSALKNDFFIAQYLKGHADKNLIYTDKVDFELQPRTRLKDEALLRIAEDLIEKGKIPLPAFSLGFLRYEMMTSPQKNVQEKYPFLYKVRFLNGELANEICNSIINSAIDIATEGSKLLPGIGFFTKKATNLGYKRVVEWIQNTNAKKVLGDLDELSAYQLLERLPKLLAFDVNKYLRSELENGNSYPQKRIVIMIDGYETLWRDEVNPNIDKDVWVKELVKQMPGVLFVFFGRDKIRWGETEEVFDKILDQHLIKGLSDHDADGFLQLSGITEEGIRSQIVQSSKDQHAPEDGCLPFYLDLQIGTYNIIKRSGKVPNQDNFTNRDEEVITHFFEHLHPSVAQAIKALSLALYIDEEIIELFTSNNFVDPGAVSIKSLSRHSFIRIVDGRASLHGLMKEMATRQFKDEFPLRYQTIHQLLFDYYEKQLPTGGQELNAKVERILEYASYHKELIDRPHHYLWAWKKSELFHGVGSSDSLVNILHNAYHIFFENRRAELNKEELTSDDLNVDELHALAGINMRIALRYNWTDDFRDGLKFIGRFHDVIDLALTEDLKREIQSSIKSGTEEKHPRYELAVLKLEGLELHASFHESLDEMLDADIKYKEANSHADDFNLNFNRLAYARFISDQGRFAESEPIIFRNYQLYEQWYSEDVEYAENFGLAAHNLANLLSKQHRFDEALKYHDQAIEMYERTRTREHEYYAIVKGALMETLIAQKKFSASEDIKEEVLEILTKKYENEHLNFALVYVQIGNLYGAYEDQEQANTYYEKASKIYAQSLGPLCRSALSITFKSCFLAKDLYEKTKLTKQQFNISVRMLTTPMKHSFELFKNTFGIYNHIFHKAIAIVVDDLRELGDISAADSMQRKKDEFVRITKKRTNIRCDNFEAIQITADAKLNYFSLLGGVMSVPVNPEFLDIAVYRLPFFKTFNLLKILYKNTDLETQRYVLSDGKTALLIDYKNSPIYTIAEADGCIGRENCTEYVTFLQDSVCGRHGFFYVIDNFDDIPWRVDVEITPEYKATITKSLFPIRFVEEDEISCIVEFFTMFNNNVFYTKARICKEDIVDPVTGEKISTRGNYSLFGERLCIFTSQGDIIFEVENSNNQEEVARYVDFDGNNIDISGLEIASEILACIDPQYKKIEAFDTDRSSNHQVIRQCMSLASLYTEHFLMINEATEDSDDDNNNEEEVAKLKEVLEAAEYIAQRMDDDLDIELEMVKYILEVTIEYVTNWFDMMATMMAHDDARLEPIAAQINLLKRGMEIIEQTGNQ